MIFGSFNRGGAYNLLGRGQEKHPQVYLFLKSDLKTIWKGKAFKKKSPFLRLSMLGGNSRE